MQATVKKWLEEGAIDVFLGYKSFYGHPLPYCFVKERLDDVNDMVDGAARYPLEKIAVHLSDRQPDVKIGMLARDCNQRALKVLSIWNKLDPENIRTVSANCCPSILKKHADCSYLNAPSPGLHKKKVGIDGTQSLETLEDYPDHERFSRWMYEFRKCLKCYGCRNICPVCFCDDCSLEHKDLVGTGKLPPDVPIFHLVRAVHMAGRCIDCGLCEDACPVDIPLRLLYRKVNELCIDLFDYETGVSDGRSPFNMIGGDVTLEPKPMHGQKKG
ncbi:MAG: 4Fe-4S dicluster domain-containing protein [Deltaproteobacteria bacterium]|nr:4Fe-4S dicluster domain-containing protein [Deltaproteobacteria bacterium]